MRRPNSLYPRLRAHLRRKPYTIKWLAVGDREAAIGLESHMIQLYKPCINYSYRINPFFNKSQNLQS